MTLCTAATAKPIPLALSVEGLRLCGLGARTGGLRILQGAKSESEAIGLGTTVLHVPEHSINCTSMVREKSDAKA